MPAASKFARVASAMGTACSLSLAASHVSAATMIWWAPSTIA